MLKMMSPEKSPPTKEDMELIYCFFMSCFGYSQVVKGVYFDQVRKIYSFVFSILFHKYFNGNGYLWDPQSFLMSLIEWNKIDRNSALNRINP